MQECGLISKFVKAGLRWTSNSYIPLLFFIFISRKFKHFSSFSFSIINWMCLSCVFKIFWNSRDCSLDLNRAWVSSIFSLYVFGARYTHSRPMFPFYSPWKRQKTWGFLTFSGGYRKGTLAWNGLRLMILQWLCVPKSEHNFRKKQP